MLKLQAKVVAVWVDDHLWTVHCVRSSEWSTSPTCMCIIPMYFRPTLKIPPPNVISPIFFGYFSRSGLHPWFYWLLERSQIPSCPRELQTCTRLMQGWVASAEWHRPCAPPQTKILATPVQRQNTCRAPQMKHKPHYRLLMLNCLKRHPLRNLGPSSKSGNTANRLTNPRHRAYIGPILSPTSRCTPNRVDHHGDGITIHIRRLNWLGHLVRLQLEHSLDIWVKSRDTKDQLTEMARDRDFCRRLARRVVLQK